MRWRCGLVGFLLMAAAPAALWSAAEPPAPMLGEICHAEPPIDIAGPHRLVMLPGMGNDQMAADTVNPQAQRWFDYGLTLARSFQHGDAALAFQRAQTLDPACSLCVWGEAWARGPNINFPPPLSELPGLLTQAKKAKALARADAPARVKGLEAALVDRYGAADPKTGDLAFAHDMDAMTKADPRDVETAIFDAEAWLVVERDGDPTAPARAEQVLAPLLPAHPDSSGLVHFYIHASEESGHPERAAPYAGRLAELAPNASHMVHMPSHTWYRLGRYEEAARANLDALAADRAYAEKTDFPTPLGAIVYHAHDLAFGLAAALMAQDAKAGLKFVAEFNRDFPTPTSFESASGVAWRAYAAFGRFAPPDQVLAAPDTVAGDPYLEAMRHYARGEAELRRGEAGAARAEAALISTPPKTGQTSKQAALVEVARRAIAGGADMLDRRFDAAASEFGAAADLQDRQLSENGDPPDWWYPVRRDLAAARLGEGDAAGAVQAADKALGAWKLDTVSLAIRARAETALAGSKTAAGRAPRRALG